MERIHPDRAEFRRILRGQWSGKQKTRAEEDDDANGHAGNVNRAGRRRILSAMACAGSAAECRAPTSYSANGCGASGSG